MLLFEWDENKNIKNIEKHSISFTEAATVFKDILSLSYFDPDHSEGEERSVIIGLSEKNNLLVVAYTERNDNIRLISARKATKFERRDYEQRK